MRSRLLSIASAMTLVLGGLVIALAPASPASAHCSGHGTHPDRYEGGGISYRNGVNIRSHPHTNCSSLGLGYPGHSVDVHCAADQPYPAFIYIRNLTTGVNGWSREDFLNGPTLNVPLC